MKFPATLKLFILMAALSTGLLLLPGCDSDETGTGATDTVGADTAVSGADDPGAHGSVPETTGSTVMPPKAAAPFDPAKLGTVERDVTYGNAGGVQLKMDIYYPKQMAEPVPAVMYVHGGGWTEGNKDNGAGAKMISPLQDAGFLVVSIDYRLAPEYKFPAQIEDVKCAVRFLRANATQFGIDPGRIGAIGGSAGGHLVSLLGVTDENAGLEGSGGSAGQSSRVQAVVDMFGPSDLSQEFGGGAAGNALGSSVFGTSDRGSDILKQASPVTYVSADDPAFLILQGDQDNLVPPSQSQELHDVLQAAGVPSTLVMVKNAGHGFKPDGGAISPTLQELNSMIVDFFSRELK